MAVATSYSAEWLQFERPQPMYDKSINRLYREIFQSNPGENDQLIPHFKATFLAWMKADQLNTLAGLEAFEMDVCIGCTQFIDDLYQTHGYDKIMVLQDDYRYHWRLNQNLRASSLQTLVAGKQLLIAMPFPRFGDVHPEMGAILARCLELQIPVHVDAAWLSCSRDIGFDFSHPAIQSFAISLSKGMGTGGNRIGMRFSRTRQPGPITIMNDFNMNCQSLVHIGICFMEKLGANYFWKKYGDSYLKICNDFDLRPTKAIHVAMGESGPVGLRQLLRFLNDR